jgi:hypothetical protein
MATPQTENPKLLCHTPAMRWHANATMNKAQSPVLKHPGEAGVMLPHYKQAP